MWLVLKFEIRVMDFKFYIWVLVIGIGCFCNLFLGVLCDDGLCDILIVEWDYLMEYNYVI